VATGYAQGTRARRPTGTVWQALVEPWRLLARNEGPDNRDEAEYVVDTDGLDVLEHRPHPQVLYHRTDTAAVILRDVLPRR